MSKTTSTIFTATASSGGHTTHIGSVTMLYHEQQNSQIHREKKMNINLRCVLTQEEPERVVVVCILECLVIISCILTSSMETNTLERELRREKCSERRKELKTQGERRGSMLEWKPRCDEVRQ